MRIGIKWQAVLVPTVLMGAVLAALLLLFNAHQARIFEQQIIGAYRFKQQLFENALDATEEHLSTVKTLLLPSIDLYNESSNKDSTLLSAAAEAEDLAYIGLWSDAKITKFFGRTESVAAIQAKLDEFSDSGSLFAPAHVFCDGACYFLSVQPFNTMTYPNSQLILVKKIDKELNGLGELLRSDIVLTHSSADDIQTKIADSYQRLDWSSLLFFHSEQLLQSQLIEFNESNYQKSFSSNVLFDVNGACYAISILSLNHHSLSNSPFTVLLIKDYSFAYTEVFKPVHKGLVLSVVLLVVNMILVYIFARRVSAAIQRVNRALLLLPKKRFAEAVNSLRLEPSFVQDETRSLEESTDFITRELGNLHDEIDAKSLLLQEQVLALRNSRSFLGRLFDNADVFIVTHHLDGEVFNVNKRAAFLGDIIGTPFTRLYSQSDDVSVFEERVEHLKNHRIDSFYQESSLRTNTMGALVVRWTHTMVEDERGKEVILSIGMDYTKQKSAEENLRWLANHDSLTALGNRRSFNEMVLKLVDSGKQFVIIFFDVNKFKVINDVYGHSAGDAVLIDIATQVKPLLGKSDLVFRLAGDEFTAIVEDSGSGLVDLLAKLSKVLERTIITYDGKKVYYSVSIGAARYPQHGATLEELVVNADMAMYHSKQVGDRSWHIFDIDDEHASKVREETKLLIDLRRAISEERFSLVYQPILDIKSNHANHFEALIRMKGEDGAFISPGKFIPLAEKYGEIRAIDEWVLDRGLHDLQKYSNSRSSLKFSINISAPTLQSKDFPAMVFHKVFTHRVDPANIVIELTETAYIENFNQVLYNLNELAKHGVQIALDDFGVGFSSFNYLKQLPLTYVKLDGSYVKNIVKNKDDQTFVRSLNAMISAFSMQTIAEFVEDEETLARLRDLGVEYAQGYHICEPLPILALMNSAKFASV